MTLIAASIWRRIGFAFLFALGLAAAPAFAQTPYTVTRDIAYRAIPGVDPNLLSLDIYAPNGADGRNPVMIMVHGGSFISGDKAGQPGVARPPLIFPKMEHYTARGFVFVSINYRLTTPGLPLNDPDQVSHPDHIEDVAAAVAWVKGNISRYGGDGRRIVLVGHSAGATLVALAATDARRLGAHGLALPDLAGIVALDGLYDIPRRMPCAAPYMRLVFTPDAAVQRDASPIFHVQPGKGIPPMLIVYNTTSTDDATQEQSLAFTAALSGAGAAAEAYAAAGKTHAEIGADLGKPGDPLSDKVDAFLAGLGF